MVGKQGKDIKNHNKINCKKNYRFITNKFI